jgi:phosphatidate cytidylyltransferase
VLLTRILSAAVLVPLLVWATLAGGLPFAAFTGAATAMAAFELSRMFLHAFRDRLAGTVLPVLAFGAAGYLPDGLALPSVLLLVLLACFHYLAGAGTVEEKASRAAVTVLAVLYVGCGLACYPRLVAFPGGARWVLLVVLVTALGDTFAYFGGRAFGRTPLSALSPKKTVEGSATGLLASVAFGYLYAGAALPPVPRPFLLAGLAALAVAGQAGDLFESLLKRAAGVKDSGNTIPGHGGMFDRADSLVAAGPVAWAFVLVGCRFGWIVP